MQDINKRVLLLCATSKMVLSFRTDLIKKFISEGYEVGVCAFDELYKKEIESLGVKFYSTEDNNRSINPLKILSLKGKYIKIIKDFNPSIVFTFMLKPNIFGTLAAKSCKVSKIYSMVEGAGDTFVNKGLKWFIIRTFVCTMYKSAFKKSNKVVFLNDDDKSEFIKRKLVKEEKAVKIGGIGVNLEKYAFNPIENENNFLMVARLNQAKGVFEYCNLAREVKKVYPNANFCLLGGEGTITKQDIIEYINEGSINYYGETNSVYPYLKGCSVFVLPTYREGFPVSVMEAQSVGRAVIVSDTIGCKDTVENGFNGFKVPVQDINALKEKCIYFIENPEKIVEMGQNARQFAENNFDQEKINNKIIQLINE